MKELVKVSEIFSNRSIYLKKGEKKEKIEIFLYYLSQKIVKTEINRLLGNIFISP